MIWSRDIMFVENAFDIEKSDKPSHKFFTGEFKDKDEVEEPNDPQVTVNEDTRLQWVRRLLDRPNILTGD